MQQILFISDPLDKFKLNGDSTYLLMLTASDLGYQVVHALPSDIYSHNQHALVNCHAVNLAHGVAQIHSTAAWYSLGDLQPAVPLTAFAGVMVRSDPPFNMEYYYLCQILDLAAKAGVKVINPPHHLLSLNEKLSILNFPKLIAPTLVTKDRGVMLDFIRTHGVCVAKPIDLMAGRGVFRVSLDDPNHQAILETLSNYFQQTIMLQKFIPEVSAGDKRIYIINGQVLSHCLNRIPQAGQIRGNLAAGGRGVVQPLSSEDYQLAQKVANWMEQQGILLAGIDVIGNYLTEINITSPTGMQQLYSQAGINAAELILNLI